MDEKEEIAKYKKVIADQANTLKAQDLLIRELTKQLDAEKELVKRHLLQLKSYFESSSEQLMLFNEPEAEAELGAIEEAGDVTKVRPYVRKKARNAFVELPADTPIIDIPDETTITKCSRCGSEMKEVSEKVYETFSRVSYTVVVRRHVKQFSCTKCTPEKDGGRLVETPSTGNMLDGTICDPSLLANIITNKYQMGLPLYRQQMLFDDVGLSRHTMSSWLMKVGDRLMDNMAPLLEDEVYKHPLVNMDETPLKVLDLTDEDGDKKAPNSKYNSFMVVRAAIKKDGKKGPVLFTFRDNRRNQTIFDLIGNYKGALQTDGLNAYANAEKDGSFSHYGCLTHSRRKAVEANGKRTNGPAFELLELYGAFFHKEGELRDKWLSGGFGNNEAYVAERRKELKPLLDAIFEYCTKNVVKAAPKSALRTALAYPLERRESLYGFLDLACATSSNQTAENAIRPFVVGRKAFLFCITENGAEVSAFFYSLIESCKAMGIDAEDYLTWLFLNGNNIKNGDVESWKKMLPGKSDISAGKTYRERLRLAEADPNRSEPYVLRGKRV